MLCGGVKRNFGKFAAAGVSAGEKQREYSESLNRIGAWFTNWPELLNLL